MSRVLKTVLFVSLSTLVISVPLKTHRPSALFVETYRSISTEFKELKKLSALSQKNRDKVNSLLEEQYSKEIADLKDVDQENMDELSRAIDHMKAIGSFIKEQCEWRKKDYATLIWYALQRVSNWRSHILEKTGTPAYPLHVGNVTSKKYS